MNLKQTPEQWAGENPNIMAAVRNVILDIVPKRSRTQKFDELLFSWVWYACACAATYEIDDDKDRADRISDTRELAFGRNKLKKHIEGLRAALNENPKLANSVCGRTLDSLRQKNISLYPNDDSYKLAEELFNAILEEMASAVNKPALGQRNGNVLHRFSHGCLLYPKPLDKVSKLVGRDVMLLFSVVLYFRLRTYRRVDSNRLARRADLQEGEPMPLDGKPNFPAAVKIVKAIFPDSKLGDYSTAQSWLQTWLKENDGVTLISWRHHRADP